MIRGKTGKTGKFLGYVLPAEELRELLESLFVFGKENQQAFFWRMTILLIISTVICTAGLLSDSAAVVIGAMLVAPMMRPVMSCAAAITLSWPKRFKESLIMISCMAIGTIFIAFLLAWASPDTLECTQQVLDRTKPTFFDLIIALAAGCGGAYTMTRKEASAIPGVAMAVALLPPLASCGILLFHMEYDLATKAFILFFTNFAAMVLAGTLTFRAVGVTAKVDPARKSVFFQAFLLVFTLALILTSIPLYVYSHEVWFDAMYQAKRSDALQTWLKSNQLKLKAVKINKDESLFYLKLVGPMPPLNIEELYHGIEEVRTRETGRTDPFKLEISWSQEAQLSWPPEVAKKEDIRKLQQNNLAELERYVWQWSETQYADGDWLRAGDRQPRVIFLGGNKLEVITSCKKGLGHYSLSQESIEIEVDLHITDNCKDYKIDGRFAIDINNVITLDIHNDRLVLQLDNDSGVMYFEGVKRD